MNYKLVCYLVLSIIIVGCVKRQFIYFYSPNKKQCITIIDEDKYRYVINGRHNKLPNKNYLKLSLRNIDPIGDSFHICWDNGRYEWDAVVQKSVIIESTLDTSRFNFNTELPTDVRGIPNEIKFRNDNCSIYSFYLKRFSPNKGEVVEYN